MKFTYFLLFAEGYYRKGDVSSEIGVLRAYIRCEDMARIRGMPHNILLGWRQAVCFLSP